MVVESNLIKELLSEATEKLQTSMKMYKDGESQNMKLLEAFNLEDLLEEIPLELFKTNDIVDLDFARQIGAERCKYLSNKLFIAQLDTRINILKNYESTFQDTLQFLENRLKIYEEDFSEKPENCHKDLMDISTLEADIQKKTGDIYQADDQLENKRSLINKLRECYELKNKIDECKMEKNKINEELKTVRILPPNLLEAEKKLKEIQKKLRETSQEFSRLMQGGDNSYLGK